MDESRLVGRSDKDIERLKKNEDKFLKSAEKYAQETGSEAGKVNMTEKRKVTFTSDAKGFLSRLKNRFASKDKAESTTNQSGPNVKATSEEEKKIVSIDHKVVFTVAGVLVFIFVLSFLYGLMRDSSSKAAEESKSGVKAASTSSASNRGAVTGDHLTNVPVDYASLAEAEARKKQKERKPRPDEIDAVKTRASAEKKVDYSPAKAPEPPKEVPNTVTVPNNDARNRLQEAYIRKLEKEQEAKFKALEAPIRFELAK